MNTYSISHDEQKRSWCVHFESAEGAVEVKCFKERDAAIGYGRWLAQTSTYGRLTIRERDGTTQAVRFGPG